MPVKLTQEDFLLKAKSVHGDRYDYSETVYRGTNHAVKITCKLHGSFLQKTYQALVWKKLQEML